MIYDTLAIIKRKLEEEISRSTLNWTSEDKVVLSNLYGADGQLALKPNCVAISLINTEQTHANMHSPGNAINDYGNIEQRRLPLSLTLSVLFTANFEHYDQSLKILSLVMAFFQNTPSLSRDDAPDMAEGIEKLRFKLFSQNLEQAKDIWSFLGGRYLPSVMYNVIGTEITRDQVYRIASSAQGPSDNISERMPSDGE